MKGIIYLILFFPIFLLIGCSQNTDSDVLSSPGPDDPSNTINETPAPPELTPEAPPRITPAPTPETSQPAPLPTPEPEPVFGFIDAHADTISRAMQLDPDQQSLLKNDGLHIDFTRLSEYEAPVQVFVAWCAERYVPIAFEYTNMMFDFFEQEVARNSDLIEIALDLEDIRRISGEGKISAILAIEGGEALMGDIANLDHFYERGVRILGLTWNRENELGYGQATGSTQGLKQFGRDVVRRMDELGMIVDVSHLNYPGFWDVHRISTRPFMASHSNVFDIMPLARNLLSDQILAIADSGGIIGFNMYSPLISSGDRVTTEDIMAHFRHYVHLGVENHIGLGCDFDGISSTPENITDVSSLKTFRESLAEEFDEILANKIMEKNFYEFFKRYFEG